MWQEPHGKRDARAFHNLPESASGATVFDLEPWREELRRLRGNSDAWEVNCQALYKALEAAEVKFPKLVA